MKNYRASTLYNESMPLANARSYYDGAVSYSDILSSSGYADIRDEDMWTSLSVPIKFFGDSAENFGGEGKHADKWKDGDENLWAKILEIAGGRTYFPLTKEAKEIFIKVSKAFEDKNPEAYKEWCFSREEKTALPWEDVGFIKNDDYTFTVVLNKAFSNFMFLYHSSSLVLLREDLYEANKQKAGDITKSTYGTNLEKSASYGPYKIASYQDDKSISLCRNQNWYGYSDGKHENMCHITNVDFQFLSNQNTILNLFLQGELDIASLSTDDMQKYGTSDFREDTPQSYTYKLSFNIDRKSLEKENASGINHSIIANINFRHAVSLSIDRQKWVDTLAPASEPGFGLLNYYYVAVPETGALYRNTEQAKQALMDFYGASTIEDITGYDVAKAREYFQKAYDEEIAAGYLNPSDKIQIDMHLYGSDEGYQRRVSFLQDAVSKASEGTGLEGKITIKLVVDQNYYNNMKTGNVDLSITAWGGAGFDPYNILWCYATKEALNEYGFDPYTEKLAIELNGKRVEKTYNEWYKALTTGEYSASPSDTKNTILASCEKGLLGYYNMIPVQYLNSTALISQRTERYSDHFINELVSSPSKVLMLTTLTMDDDEWASYCKEQNNQLKY